MPEQEVVVTTYLLHKIRGIGFKPFFLSCGESFNAETTVFFGHLKILGLVSFLHRN